MSEMQKRGFTIHDLPKSERPMERLQKYGPEALVLALKKKLPLAVDDLPTIKACKILNQRFVTAINFLITITVRGKISKDISMVKLEKLSLYGRYSKRILEDATKRLKGGE